MTRNKENLTFCSHAGNPNPAGGPGYTGITLTDQSSISPQMIVFPGEISAGYEETKYLASSADDNNVIPALLPMFLAIKRRFLCCSKQELDTSR